MHEVAGIKIQPCKMKLFHFEVEYLGHKISKGGVWMIPEYVHRIKDWPVPKSGKEVVAFLGFAGYYRTFIPQYLALINRLNGIKKFLWNEKIKRDFVQLKKAFTEGFHRRRDTNFSRLRSRRSIHFNHSLEYATSVPLVLNTVT